MNIDTSRRVNSAVNKAVEKCTVNDDNKKMTINVIVHICYQEKETSDSVTDIMTMIETLNDDYNGNSKNFDVLGKRYKGSNPPKSVYKNMLALKGCANIEFILMKTLYKKLVPPLILIDDDDMDAKNETIKINHSPAVNPDKCLNIWIVENIGGGLLGYSSFPWDSIIPSKLKYDGVVMDRSVFGAKPTSTQYNMNKTITHEVGHWTGLYHTFQQGTITSLDAKSVFIYKDKDVDKNIIHQESTGDCIADTPYQDEPTYNNPFNINNINGKKMKWPCSMEQVKDGNNIIQKKSWHMFMNFMDYSDDDALFMFTNDQVTKMRLMLKMFRPHTVGYNGTQHNI